MHDLDDLTLAIGEDVGEEAELDMVGTTSNKAKGHDEIAHILIAVHESISKIPVSIKDNGEPATT